MADPLEVLKQQVLARNLHPPAGAASPVVLRALDAVRKLAPHKAAGIVLKEDWNDPDAFSNTLGSVRIGDKTNVNVNPGLSMMRSQDQISRILGHELEHVWQNRNDDPQDSRLRKLELLMPYAERPSELAAQDVANSYGFNTEPEPKLKPMQDVAAPLVMKLFESGRRK